MKTELKPTKYFDSEKWLKSLKPKSLNCIKPKINKSLPELIEKNQKR